jgi:protein-disulfide isomerase
MRGPHAAKVTIAVFSDFQCPFCSRVGPTMDQIARTWPKDVRIVWKHQPLPMHANALPAAEAAEAARLQGKFWPMHDKLFAGQAALGPEKYEAFAREAGLDLTRFKRDVASHAGRARIDEDQKLANQVGAQGTPTLFVNCRKVTGAKPFEEFKPMIEEELRKADALLAKGAKLDAAFYDTLCAENVRAAPAPAPEPRLDAAQIARELRADDPARGPASARVTVVAFSDFQCPFCSRAVPTLEQVVRTWPKDVRVVWKHQPLAMHPNALPAALAAEAARQQGKFWQMHDQLFAHQADLSGPALERLAGELHLDLARFRAAMSDPKARARVAADQAFAGRLGITGTPTFLVNGEKVAGAQPFEAFKAAIDRQLAAKLTQR